MAHDPTSGRCPGLLIPMPPAASVEKSRRVVDSGASGRLGGAEVTAMMRPAGPRRKAAGNPERYPHVCLSVIEGPV